MQTFCHSKDEIQVRLHGFHHWLVVRFAPLEVVTFRVFADLVHTTFKSNSREGTCLRSTIFTATLLLYLPTRTVSVTHITKLHTYPTAPILSVAGPGGLHLTVHASEMHQSDGTKDEVLAISVSRNKPMLPYRTSPFEQLWKACPRHGLRLHENRKYVAQYIEALYVP